MNLFSTLVVDFLIKPSLAERKAILPKLPYLLDFLIKMNYNLKSGELHYNRKRFKNQQTSPHFVINFLSCK